MRSLLCFVFALLVGCQQDPAQWVVEHHLEEVDAVEVDLDSTVPLTARRRGALGSNPVKDLESIANTGVALWSVVKDNEANTEARSFFANALPALAADGTELEGFSELQTRTFRAYGTNLYGVTVYDVRYSVLHRFGGAWDGKGQYLDQVAVVPVDVTALWGYSVDVTASAGTPSNVGTKDAPVATLLLEVGVNVSTVMKSNHSARVWELRGDRGALREVTPGVDSRGAVHLASVAP